MSRTVGQNVAEMFVVIGWDNSFDVDDSPNGESDSTSHGNETPSIFSVSLDAALLDHYPTHDALEHIPSGLQYLCFPLGLSIKDVPLPPQFHSFIHTSQDGSRLIGSVLTFYEEVSQEQRQILSLHGFDVSDYTQLFVQKGICILSHWPFLSAFKKFLTGLYQISLSPSYIPVERYICNFIDDVPAPTSGKVDITYFLEDEAIQFQCPPLNEPNAWSGFPLFPLFECLSAINIVTLFGLMFVERPIVFISSQYSLLTLCCEAMTSLLYPFRWAHSYVPILPSKLIGILSAPVPCIFGVHTDVYLQNAVLVSPEIVKVFLDDNRVDCGELGPPPKFPEGRYRKLINAIIENVSWLTKTGDLAYTNQLWKVERLSLFDDALTDVTNNPMENFWRPSTGGRVFSINSSASKAAINEKLHPNSTVSGNALNAAAKISNPRSSIRESKVNDQAIREGFLKFFVAMLKDYKRFLIYTDVTDNSPGMHMVQERFRFDDFIREQPAEWRPLLETLKDLQAFSNFLDDRIALNKLDRDVIFFDESIEAKLNRYTFRSKNFDTPFLTYEKDKHIKTYVPPSPFRSDLLHQEIVFPNGPNFPRLQAKWFIPPRNLGAKFPAPKDQILTMLCRIRLKRKWTSSVSLRHDHLSGSSCIYSSYLVITSLLISHAVEQTLQMLQRLQTPSLSALEVLREEMRSNSISNIHYNSSSPGGNAVENRRRRKSEESLSMSFSNNSISNASAAPNTQQERQDNQPTEVDLEKHKVKESAIIGLLVSLEILSSLTKGGHLPDEITYRLLAEACADLGRPWNLLDMIVFMDELDFIPDHQIRMALIRSINMAKQLRNWTLASANNNSTSSSSSDTSADTSAMRPMTREMRSDTAISSRSDPGVFCKGKVPSSSALDRMVPTVATTAVPVVPSSPVLQQQVIRRNSGTNAAVGPTSIASATMVMPNGVNRGQKVAERQFPLTPAEVWTFNQWNTLQRPDTTVVLRSTVFGASSVSGTGGRSEDVFSKIFFGITHPSSTPFSPSGTSNPQVHHTVPVAPGIPNSSKAGDMSPRRPPTGTGSNTPTASSKPFPMTNAFLSPANPLPPGVIVTNTSASNHSGSSSNNSSAHGHSGHVSGTNTVVIRGPLTGASFEGFIPHLIWSVTEKDPRLSPRNTYATSPKLHRQVKLGETLLCSQYPDLHIDFSSDHGMKCPNLSCPYPRPLTIAEVFQGWSAVVHESVMSMHSSTFSHGHTNTATTASTAAAAAVASFLSNGSYGHDYANRYTCRCVYCGTDFIPRFAVRSSAKDWEGSDGPGSALWCEFLSPWTLHKEVLNIIFEHGVTELLSSQFRSSSHQRAVVFWNLIVSFRLRGLPVAVLLTDGNIKNTFPPK